ncbi:MAG: hypothetical protein EB078_03730 [Proteobacteria bacterium]|nr:hypothetical protein [Pseudomonadota bacterium]NDC23954.1 hypothetical protein [Pseudomonadota bacterium]NDD03993.1 hypothetical protein [Pseudomonadota bacterium]NDG26590.1 hypothetical protein [Pseudomonadota bacterium]
MAFRIPFKYRKTLSLPKSTDEVLPFLHDFSHSIPACFPGLERFEAQTTHEFFWEFTPLTYAGKTVVIHFSTSFSPRPNGLQVAPASKERETLLNGAWVLTPASSDCTLTLSFDLELNIPLPSLMRSMIAPLAEKELKTLFDQYAENITTHFA